MDKTTEILEGILSTLQRIEKKLDKLTVTTGNSIDTSMNESSPLDIMTILNNNDLDDNLIPTIRALLTLGKGTADEIAKITTRSRPRENQHLNRLVELNYVQKAREGRKIVFEMRI